MKVSSVLVGREVYPLLQAGKSLSSKVFYFRDESLSSVLSGREDFWHHVLKMSYPLFQAGKVSITCKFLVYPLFQAGNVSITC